MLAIDTYLIVRYLTGDHPRQSAQARAVLDDDDVFVATTVLLETDWVLRSVYGYSAAEVCNALRAFAGLPRVTLEDAALIAAALDRTAQGMDFADALHLGRADHCAAFVTFDRELAKAAKGAGIANVQLPVAR